MTHDNTDTAAPGAAVTTPALVAERLPFRVLHHEGTFQLQRQSPGSGNWVVVRYCAKPEEATALMHKEADHAGVPR